MWERWKSLENVQQDAILICGSLNYHIWGMCDTWAWQGSFSYTFWTNVWKRCIFKWHYFCMPYLSSYPCKSNECKHPLLCFNYAMVTDYMNISTNLEHYTYMVNLLGCANYLQEVEIWSWQCFVNHMLLHGYITLLGVFRIHGNVEMLECVARKILEIELDNATSYVLLWNIYVGHMHLSKNVEWHKKEKNVKKPLGHT